MPGKSAAGKKTSRKTPVPGMAAPTTTVHIIGLTKVLW
jgi:hypothetical protein